ncbi:hypothetical protein [Acidianus manzaensis]|uniref:Uncharacterized protein n=1 Tax=Acidianus manzaensis TaxID=282676 RepID=A0A1W6K2Q9_9CREN|nr:hypothetical protein [Acidianus manzaensis]ARM76809.1 hypothetical protein B6F84_12795 [Acidianus manzaensis]
MDKKVKKKNKERLAISNIVFVGVVILLIVVAAVGFGLYATKPPTKVVTTKTSSVTVTSTSTVTSTVTSTSTVTKTIPVTVNSSGAFYDGKVITFMYTAQFECTPNGSVFFPNAASNISVAQGCEVGAGNISDFPKGAAPMFVLVPAFAGLSIFGVQKLGATAQGFPTFTYNNTTYTILTQCGAADTPTACPDHMSLIYSPAFTAVEEHLGIYNGVFGLPEGVLPTPAHEHLVTFTTNTSIPWYLVIVLVFNPNIYPNPITGQCTQIVPSNVSDPTGDCLNNINALEAAMTTYDSAVPLANAKNPIWTTLGEPGVDVVIPGISSPADLFNTTNSNMVLFFSDPPVFPYPV